MHIEPRSFINATQRARRTATCGALTPGRLFVVITLLFILPQAAARAASLPTGFAETQIAGGISNPTAMAFAPDGRIFVCLQGGQVRVVKNGALLPTPFLSLSVDSAGERGLLGIAFDPNFSTNQYVYLYYTTSFSPKRNRISRFTASGDTVVAGSEAVILELDNLTGATNHNGGAMHFGEDGRLYIAVGENATPSNAQTLANLHGKMLRINADGSIPTDNPFFSTAAGKNRAIWALGLRNPFTFALQPGTDRMFINDVGQGTWEEINDGAPGANFGWPTCEGGCGNPNFTNPIHQYQNDGSTCAITGGTFYNPATNQFPLEYFGKYFFADYCGGWIRRLDPANNSVTGFATGISAPVDLQVSADGSLYYLARGGGGALYRISYTASQAPSITTQPASRTASVGQTATFTVSASGTAPLAYQWQRNGANISGANAASYTTPPVSAADNNAQFRVVVSNPFGSATSNSATLTVTPNQPPVGTIVTPAAGTLYTAGETVTFSGTATDPEQGTLPASAFTWQVDFFGGAESRPFLPPTSGSRSGSFTPATRLAYTEADAFYRIILTVTDAQGQTHTTFRDVQPRTATITLATVPPGLEVTLDGQPRTAPSATLSVVGVIRAIGAPSPQTVNGTTYEFQSWSDGGADVHEIATPPANTTYTATFNGSGGGAAAAFVGFDDATQGNWRGTYGTEGYQIVADSNSLPAYAQATVSGQLAYTWNGATNDVRALQRISSATERVAATWYSHTSFTINLNLTDGQTHRVSLYNLDWDNLARQQLIEVVDANTGAVLDSRALAGFTGGRYAIWNLRGHVLLRVTLTGGHNAVVSALFFDDPDGPPPPSQATFVRSDDTTQGNWQGAYGAEGYAVANHATSLPAFAQLTPSNNHLTYTWNASTSDVRALRKTGGATDRIAATWYTDDPSFALNLNLTDGQTRRVALYCVDWDNLGRAEVIEVVDANTGAVLDSRPVSAFVGGRYLVWDIRGRVQFRVTKTAGKNPVVSGLFLGAP